MPGNEEDALSIDIDEDFTPTDSDGSEAISAEGAPAGEDLDAVLDSALEETPGEEASEDGTGLTLPPAEVEVEPGDEHEVAARGREPVSVRFETAQVRLPRKDALQTLDDPEFDRFLADIVRHVNEVVKPVAAEIQAEKERRKEAVRRSIEELQSEIDNKRSQLERLQSRIKDLD